MPQLPSSSDDYIALADWLELAAIVSSTSSASAALLERALTASPQLIDPEEDNEIEAAIGRVFHELTERQIAAGDAYPIAVRDDLIELKGAWPTYTPYIFCLVLSYFSRYGSHQYTHSDPYPARWFEHLSRDAAQSYMSGVAVRFAFPREPRELPREFRKAVDFVCQEIMMEGLGYRPEPYPDDLDAGIDILACRHFPDHLPGKMLLFGQCASGKWWRQKVDELRPEIFAANWLQDQLRSPFLRCLFIPHRIDIKTLYSISRSAGVVFDRCRIALWADRFSNSGAACGKGRTSYFPMHECRSWIKDALNLTGGEFNLSISGPRNLGGLS